MLAMVIMILFIVLLLVSAVGGIAGTLAAGSQFSYIGGIYHPRHAGRN